MLRVNVGVERATAEVVPGDDRPTRAVRDDGGTQLVGGSGAHDTAVRRPGRIHASSGQNVLSVDVAVTTVAVVVPGDDSPAGAIISNAGVGLAVGVGAQSAAICRPSRIYCAGGHDPLGVDVSISTAEILPRDDRSTRAI